ncbi:hypothetical protein [Embleya sp. NPDC001921]
MTSLGHIQVIHSLATAPQGTVEHDCRPEIANCLVGLGCRRPVVVDLAATAATSESSVDAMLTRLAEQSGRAPAGMPAPAFWDTVCGVVARAWRLGMFDETQAMYLMDGLWWQTRKLDERACRGLGLIKAGMGLKELIPFQDIDPEATVLLMEADRLIPVESVDAALCKAVLEAVC